MNEAHLTKIHVNRAMIAVASAKGRVPTNEMMNTKEINIVFKADSCLCWRRSSAMEMIMAVIANPPKDKANG